MSKLWKIYSKGANTSNDAPKYLAESVEYHDIWMGEEYVMVTIVTDKSPNPNDPDPFSLEIGDFIEYRGRRYFIYNVPSALKQARKHTYGEAFKYENVKFSSVGMELSEVRFLDIVLGDNQLHYTSLPTFQTYCETVEDLVDRLQANTDREHNGYDSWYFITPNKQRTLDRCIKWNGSAWVPDTERRAVAETLWNEAFSNGSYLENEKKNVSINVDKVSVWDGLGMIKNHFGLNFVLSPTTLGRVVVIGAMASDTGHDFMYGKGNGLHQIERVADSDQLVVTKLFAYGSDTNLPYHYYAELGRKPYFVATDKRAVEFIVGHPQYTLYTNIVFASISPSLNGVDNKVTLYVGNQYCTAWCEAYTPSGETTEYTRFRLIGTMQSDSPDWLLYDQITVNSTKVYISSGVNTSKWPNIDQDQDGLPDNMAVNCLMLLGFPKYALNDVVRCEYDVEINVTKFFIRRTPSDTYSSTPSFAVNGNHVLTFSTDRLRPWIKSPNVVDLGVKEGDVHFTEENDDNGLQEVHPSIEGMTEDDVFHNGSSARLDEIIAVDTIADDGYFADGEVETIPNFTITVRDLGFDLRQAYVDAGSSMKVSMKDGYCGGRDFDVKGVTQLANGQWKLTIARCPDNALELYFPYSNSVAGGGTAQANEPYQIRGPHEENGVMVSGDHFVLTDILIYDTNYVYAASVELFKKSVLWIISNDYTRFTYMPKIDEIFMAKNQDTAYSPQYYKLKAGKLMHFEDNDLQINARIFIDQLTIKEGGGQNVPTYDVVLREDKEVGTIQRMQNQISSLQSYSGSGSVAESAALKYIMSLWKLDENNHLYTDYDVYSKKSVSAFGYSPGGSGGGGATRLDGLSDVTITDPSNGQVLKYLNGKWVNAQDTGGMTINDMWNALATPYPPEVQKIIDLTHIPVLSSDKIPSLDASKITSGTFDANRVPNIENLNNFSTRVYDASATRVANTVLAAPNGSNGAASFRSLVGNDLPIATDLARGAVRIGSTLAIVAATGILNLATIPTLAAGTYTKLTVDSYGRATAGTTLVESDIPSLSISKVTGLQNALDAKLDVAFFDSLFELHSGATGNPKVNPNSTLPSDTSKYNIKAMFGFWTEKYISALGRNGDMGGSDALYSLLDVKPDDPANPSKVYGAQTGYVLTYGSDGKWYASQATGSVTSIIVGTTNYSPVNGVITLPAYPQVPSWALQPNKPSYAFSEITGSASASQVPNIEDLNNFSTKVYDASATRVANTVLAAPNGSNGVATFRALVGDDLPTASASVKGGIKVGTGLAIAAATAILSLATSGVVAGTYTKLTVDAYGRATAGTTLVASDIPDLSATYLPLSGDTWASGAVNKTAKVTAGNGLQYFYSNAFTDKSTAIIDDTITLTSTVNGFDETTTNTTVISSSGITIDGVSVATQGWVNSNFYTQAQADAKYMTIAAFENLFRAMQSDGTTSVAHPYSSGVASIKALFGLWTDQYLSALGLNSQGGGGGIGDVTWEALAGNTNEQINLSHLTTALSGYATKSWVGSQGYITSAALIGYATEQWVTDNFNKYVLPAATANALGGIKVGYTTSGKNYKIQLDANDNAFVNVPWENTTYTLADLMGSAAKGGLTQPIYWDGSKFANTTYTLGKSVPANAKFTDTTYKLTVNGTTNGDSVNGINLGSLYAIATSDATIANQVWMRNANNTGYAWRQLGARAFDDTAYLPLIGGTIGDGDYRLSVEDNGLEFRYGNTKYAELKLSNGIDGTEFHIGNDTYVDGVLYASNLYLNNSQVATQSYVDTNYVSKAFFNAIFQLQDANGTAIEPNASTEAKDRLKILVGAYTDQYLSALGLNSGGGGGGGSTTLAGLSDVTITSPSTGQLLKYDSVSQQWVNFTPNYATTGQLSNYLPLLGGTMTTGDVQMSVNANGFSWKVSGTTYGSLGFSMTPQTGPHVMVNGSDVLTEGNTYISGGTIYIGSDSITPLTTSYVSFGTAGTDYVPITIGSTTKNVLTSHQSLSGYATTGDLSSYLPLTGNSTLSGILTISPTNSSSYQDALILHDKGYGNNEGARIRFTSHSYTTGITLGPNSDKTALLINGTDTIIHSGNISSYLGSNLVTSVCGYNGAVSKAELEQGLGLSSYVKPTVVDALADGVIAVYDSGGWVTSSASTFLSSYATQNWVTSQGYVTSSGVTSVATGTGLSGGTITSAGTISINSTYQTYISHGESAYNSLSNYIQKGTYIGLYDSGYNPYIWMDGGGYRWYFQYYNNCAAMGRTFAYSLQIDASGNATAISYANRSDIRRKNVISYNSEPTFESVANAPAIKFKWKDAVENTKTYIGSIAQYWQYVLPESVMSDAEGYLTMQYDVIALLSAISVAKRVNEHERRIEALERENALLRLELNKLKENIQ